MDESGDLDSMLPKAKSLDDRSALSFWKYNISTPVYLLSRLKSLIGHAPVMLFMKGTRDVGGYSRWHYVYLIC